MLLGRSWGSRSGGTGERGAGRDGNVCMTGEGAGRDRDGRIQRANGGSGTRGTVPGQGGWGVRYICCVVEGSCGGIVVMGMCLGSHIS